MKVLNYKVPVKIWTDPGQVEQSALDQIGRLAEMPFIYKHIAVMADVHAGKGSTVGSVFATRNAIIPAAVGVDIGCGMIAQKLNITANDLPDSLFELRCDIEQNVPHGRSDNGGRNDIGRWKDVPDDVGIAWGEVYPQLKAIIDRNPLLSGKNDIVSQGIGHFGTLGTGNHFIELCLDQANNVWIMLHSGSRGIGNRIGQYFIELAKKDMQRWYCNVPDVDLSYFPEGTDHFDRYVQAMTWAQDYAFVNRQLMLKAVLASVQRYVNTKINADEDVAINCHHNYATIENHFGQRVWVTRKGAVCARKDMLGIIPGSMGTRSYIVRGLGNPQSFNSCSHGAGRVMSRTAARAKFTEHDVGVQTAGVECRKDVDIIDELPGAYKDIDVVIENQRDLIEPVAVLKQVLCVKG